MFFYQVHQAPKFIDNLLKSRICPKKVFPYGEEETGGYFDPSCSEGIYGCRDICGKKCKKECQKITHPPDCGRGKFPENFLFCPSQDQQGVSLEYISYKLVEDKSIKEGKKVYKKMDQIKEDMAFETFLKFKNDFASYSCHKLEAWILNNLKSHGSDPNHQNKQNLVCVSDFAQNLKLSKKHEVSEEYFHKTQISLYATVSTMRDTRQHTLSQISSSDFK